MAREYQSSNLLSITRMRKVFAQRIWYVLLSIVFGLSIVLYFATPNSGPASSQERDAQAVLSVNGEKIPRAAYERQWDSMKRFAAGNEVQALQFQGMILDQMVNTALARSVARQRGATVSDAEVEKAILEQKKLGGDKPVPDSEFEEMLKAQGSSLRELRDELRQTLLPQALRQQIEQQVKVTEDDLLKTYDEYKLRHILISTSKLPEAQAKAKAERVLAEVKAGKDFAALANQHSDDPSNKPQKWDPKLKKSVPAGAPKGGDLGWAPLSNYVPEFAEAARNLKKGEVSGVVKTTHGFHIIRLEDTRRKLPKDYAKNKQTLLADFRKRKADEQYQKLMEEARETAKIVWHDPTLEWRYEYSKVAGPMGGMMGGPQAGDRQKFMEKLRKYAKENPEDSTAALVVGQDLYMKYVLAPKGPEKDRLRNEVIEAYEGALKRTEEQQTRLTLAQLYRDAGKKDDALRHYKLAQRLLRWDDSTASKGVHEQLATAFRALGETKLAEEASKRVAELKEQEKREREEARRAEAKRKAEEAKKKAEAAAKKTAKADVKPSAAAPVGEPPKADGTGATKPAASAPAGQQP